MTKIFAILEKWLPIGPIQRRRELSPAEQRKIERRKRRHNGKRELAQECQRYGDAGDASGGGEGREA